MIQGRRLFSAHLFVLALGLAASLGSTSAPAANPPGASLSGELSVTPGGSASYQLPLLTPPGAVKPSLSLQYSSQGGNGPLGMGWSLGGLSQLSRCPRVKTIDGIDDGILQFNANDRLCLDGQRLILVSGTYGGNNAEYRTQIDSGLKIVGKGAFSSATTWFEVRSKDGQVMEYGRNAASRRSIIPTGSSTAVPTVWALDKVSDRFSNYYTVSYIQDAGMLYPQTISYTGNTQAGTNPQRTLTLIWEPGRPDVIPVYVGRGVSASIQRRLTGMTTNVDPARYRLHYSASEAGLSELTKVEYCPDGSTTNCIKVESEYGTDVHPTTGKRTTDPEMILANFGANQSWGTFDQHIRTLADVNGNGKLDIVGFADDGTYVSYATATGFSAPVKKLSNFGRAHSGGGWESNTVYPRMVLDINGDGMADLIGFGIAGVYVSLSTGTGFGPHTLWMSEFGTAQGWANQWHHPRMLADVNGDGLPDIVGFGSGNVRVGINTGSGFVFSPSFPSITASFHQGAGWADNNQFPRMMEDVNGDGRDDIVGFGPNGVMVSLAGPNGFQTPSLWLNNYIRMEVVTPGITLNLSYGGATYPMAGTSYEQRWHTQATHPRYLADINGDGLPDIVGIQHRMLKAYDDVGLGIVQEFLADAPEIYYAQNTGAGFLPLQLLDPGSPVVLAFSNGDLTPQDTRAQTLAARYNLGDMNQDGRGDIVIHQGPCTKFRPTINAAAGIALGAAECVANGFTQENGNWTIDNQRIIADIHGKGVVDILGFSNAGVVISRGQAKNPNQIVKFKDDLGESTVQYATLTDPLVYTKESGSVYPVAELQVPMTVVKSLLSADGIGGTKPTHYRYGGLRSHFDYGSLGFKWMESSDNPYKISVGWYEPTRLVDYKEFLQTFPLTGSLYRSQSQVCEPYSLWQLPPPMVCTVVSQEVSNWVASEIGATTDRKIYRPHIVNTTEHSWGGTKSPYPSEPNPF